MSNRINSSSDYWVSSEADYLQNGNTGSGQNTATRNVVFDPESGLKLTTVANDGDLRTLSGTAFLDSDPIANSAGNATRRMSPTYLLRWLVRLLQSLNAKPTIRQERELIFATADVAQSGPYSAISVPAGSRCRVVHIRIQNESGNIQKYVIREGDNARQRLYTGTAGFGVDQNYDSSDYVWLLSDGEDLVIDASTSDPYSFTVAYYLQPV